MVALSGAVAPGLGYSPGMSEGSHNRAQVLRRVFIGVACVAVCVLAAWRSAGIESESCWFSILPPLIAVSLALITRRLIISLAAGILVGGFLAAVPSDPGLPVMWGRGTVAGPTYVFSAITDATNIQILAFVVFVLVMISVLIVAGGLQGIVNRLARLAKGSRSTQLVTALMGLAIFIDDYANTMIVGSSMRPMADRHGISREKLAFIVDATSAPVAGIAVISTWIGYEVGLFGEVAQSLDIAKSGYAMFFDALGFRFYCILMIVFVLINVLSGRDYGSMARAQKRTRMTGAVAASDARPLTSETLSACQPADAVRVKARTAVIPIGALFLILIGALWYDGGGATILQSGAHHILNPRIWRDVLGRAENNILILSIASGISLLLALVIARLYARLALRVLGRAVVGGLRGALLPTAILVMAWSLKTVCDELQTGIFLIDAAGGALSPIWFPALLFVVAGLTSFATGTSWGTMAILIPTGIPIAFQLDGGVYGLTTMISLGAVLDGAILGDHCSPISDTTIMSSISSGCDHIHHVSTQIPYSVTVGAVAVVCGYLLSAFGVASWAGILIGAGVIAAVQFGFGRRAPART
jgi:Na+/H+ antiporter NhaC